MTTAGRTGRASRSRIGRSSRQATSERARVLVRMRAQRCSASRPPAAASTPSNAPAAAAREVELAELVRSVARGDGEHGRDEHGGADRRRSGSPAAGVCPGSRVRGSREPTNATHLARGAHRAHARQRRADRRRGDQVARVAGVARGRHQRHDRHPPRRTGRQPADRPAAEHGGQHRRDQRREREQRRGVAEQGERGDVARASRCPGLGMPRAVLEASSAPPAPTRSGPNHSSGTSAPASTITARRSRRAPHPDAVGDQERPHLRAHQRRRR